MRPATTYVDPLSPSRQEGHSQSIFQNPIAVVPGLGFSNLRAWWYRTARLAASEALSHVGANLGNWNDRTNGHHVRSFTGVPVWVRPLRWHILDRAAGWLYTLPERRP